MTKLSVLIAPAALLLASCAATPAVTQAQPAAALAPAAAPAPSFANLQALADRYVAEGKVANMLIGVAQGDQPAVWVSAGTLAKDGMNVVDDQSIYRIYSMTKPIIGVATTMLIADGKLGLDQPVSEIFPEFADVKVAVDRTGDVTDVRDPARDMTIRHLLTHTAGLSYAGIQQNAVAKAYRTAGLTPGVRRLGVQPGDGAQPESLEAFAATLAEQPLIADPGTEWAYSVSID
ncbi:MAG: serine hydrolase domain-containing protein, partial [Pacificimonas sp.]